jgi:excisionase family DNA binding protein
MQTTNDTATDLAKQSDLSPLTVSVTDAALLLGISEPTIYRLVARKLLRTLPGLRHKRITRRSLDAFCSGSVPVDR